MEVKLKKYDLHIGLCTTIIVDGVSLLKRSRFHVQMVEGFNNVIANGNVFSLFPNTNSLADIPLLPVDIII